MIVPLDPAEPFIPQLVISELLRTRHCVQGSILLVEGIEAHIPTSKSKRYRTVRLLLGDGDLCVQALLRAEMHPFVDHGSIYVGGYVKLNKFELRAISITRPKPEQQPGEAMGTGAVDEMVFLVVWDMATVGWNTNYLRMAGVTRMPEQQPRLQVRNADDFELQKEDKGKPSAGRADKKSTDAAVVKKRAATQPAPKFLARKSDTEMKDATAHGSEHALPPQQQQQPPTTTTNIGPGISHSTSTTTALLPWISSPSDLAKPLKLTPLKSIPNLPYKQNWVVNILAIVASLSEVEPAGLPPFKQRTTRLTDPSTSKQVLLTVFLDPDEFVPAVGSVVLLLGVKNHRFDGGCLKKYGNEKPPKPGARWWFENPKDIGWCDVEGLRRWWAEKSLGS